MRGEHGEVGEAAAGAGLKKILFISLHGLATNRAAGNDGFWRKGVTRAPFYRRRSLASEYAVELG
jgi:hypothetical protein